MSEGFAYIDILFFAMVAAFIALRLRSVLGRRTGHERRRGNGFGGAGTTGGRDNVVALPDRSGGKLEQEAGVSDVTDADLKAGLTQMRLADHRFELQNFLAGASRAFEMIVEAFAGGDKDALRPLLADEVYEGFARAIDERQAAGQTLDTQLIAVRKAEVVEAGMQGTVARVLVRFTSEQVNVLRDAEGKPVEGDSGTADEVVDLWTFERDTRSSDPNWALVETRTPE